MKRMIPWLPDWVGAGLVAGLMWAVWAFYANYPAGAEAALRASGTQFVLSFIVAGSLTSICAYMFQLTEQPVLRLLGALTVPLVFQFTFQYALHYATGTPYIIKTITPVMCVGLIWVSFYTRRLLRGSMDTGHTEPVTTA